MELSGEVPALGLEIGGGGRGRGRGRGAPPPAGPTGMVGGGRGEWGSGSQESLEDGHDEEHGDENSGGDEAEGDGIDGVVEVPPRLLPSIHLQRRHRRPSALRHTLISCQIQPTSLLIKFFFLSLSMYII